MITSVSSQNNFDTEPVRTLAFDRSEPTVKSAPTASDPTSIPPVYGDDLSVDPPAPPSGASDPATLQARLGELLTPDQNGLVNEEELFAAVVDLQLEQRLGADASAAFREALGEALGALTRADGYAPVEQAVLQALQTLVANGTIDAETADTVLSEAFIGAQLDGNADALFDGRGGPGDTTVATATLEGALKSALDALAQMAAGTLDVPERKLDGAQPTGGAARPTGDAANVGEVGLDGADGFLWKPRSESDGKLVVLLPPEMTGLVEGVTLRGPNGNVLDEGRATSVANGGREHFRFERPGGAYPPGTTVEIHLTDGTTREVRIGNTAARND